MGENITSEKVIDLRNHNMFYIISVRNTKKQVTGISIKSARWDIVEKIFRTSVVVQQLYKPKMFQAKENLLTNGIDYKKLSKAGVEFTTDAAIKEFETAMYDIVNSRTNIVFTSSDINDDPVLDKWFKEKFPALDRTKIRKVDIPIKLPDNPKSIEEIFYDTAAFGNFINNYLGGGNIN